MNLARPLGRMYLNSLLLLPGIALADEALREYTWLTVGEPSGKQTVQKGDDGSTTITFNFNDRGRGPNTSTLMWLDQRGYPVHLSITGNNYSGGRVDERFELLDHQAKWSSEIESGTAPAADAGFYIANNGSPELLAVLARAILNDDDQSIDLLPSGTASIDQVAEATLEQNGESKHIALYSISGLDPSPTHIWLDEQQQLFGIDYGWFGITTAGWEQHINVLKEAQEQAITEHYRNLAASLTEDTGDMLVIRGARIFDSLAGTLTEPATVFSWKGEISSVYFEEVEIPEGASVIEAGGQTLLPSLWDMHAHVDMPTFLNYLASGVSNVRDMANDPERISQLRDDVASGLIMGPDVYALGFIDKRGEFSAPTGMLADTLEEALGLVDWYAQRGFFGIKLYSSIEPSWVAPIADYAHQRDMLVMGHVPAYMNATQAIEAGYDEITHINMILLNFLGAEDLDTRTPTRFMVPGERGGDIDLSSPEVRAFIDLMVDRNISHDPTLSIFLDMFLNEPGQISPVFRDIADHFPANGRRQSIAGTGRNAGNEATFARSAQRTMELLKLLHDSGVQLLPGTDNALPGFTLIRELMYYAEAGIPANEVLQLATIGSANKARQGHRLGSISVGKAAHMHLVDGDPTEDLSTLYRVTEVIKGTQRYNAAEVLQSQGFTPFVDGGE